MYILLNPDMKELEYPVGFIPLDIFVGSIPKERHTDKVEGMPGEVNYGSSYLPRNIEINMWLRSKDRIDYRLLRDEVYSFFDSFDYFYIVEKHKPTRALKVYFDESFQPERIANNIGEVTVNARTIDNPFWVSLYTTKELNDTGYSSLVEKYGLVDSINSDNTKYKFTERNFTVWNAGNVTVEPETMYLKITATGTNGALEIRNKTTGDTFKVNATFGGDLVIDGMNTQLKGTNVFRDTNKKFISIDTGFNNFEVIGQFTDITIDFRFYYK